MAVDTPTAPTLTVEDIAAVKVALTPAIHDEIAALLPVITTDIEDALEGKTTIPAPVWGLIVLAAASVLAAIGYLLYESVSQNDAWARQALGGIAVFAAGWLTTSPSALVKPKA